MEVAVVGPLNAEEKSERFSHRKMERAGLITSDFLLEREAGSNLPVLNRGAVTQPRRSVLCYGSQSVSLV